MLDYETTELVTAISQVDSRVTVNEGRVAMWHATIGDLDYADAFDVVTAHYSTARTGEPALMPGDVRAGVAELRRKRLAAAPRVEELMADVDPDDPRYNAIWRERREAAMARPAPVPPPRALPQA
jgi:hypothetical protein